MSNSNEYLKTTNLNNHSLKRKKLFDKVEKLQSDLKSYINQVDNQAIPSFSPSLELN